MKVALSYVSSLVAAAAVFAAVPNAARADDCDRDHRESAYLRPAASPYGYGGAAYATPVGHHEDGWREDGWREDRDHDRGRHEGRFGWRAAERERLRVEFARLDAERDAFYARFGYNRWKVARYERGYQFRRAELDRRWDALAGPAWAVR